MTHITVQWEPQDEATLRPYCTNKNMRSVAYAAQVGHILACHDCSDWSAQITAQEGEIVVIEWHAPDCEFAEVMRQELALCHDTTRKGYYCPDCGMYTAEGPEPK